MSALDLQKAIYDTLNGQLSCVVLQNVPQGQPFPYCTIGDDTVSDWSTDGENGYDCTITVHTWSRSGSMAETKTIQSEIYDTMHRIRALNALIWFDYSDVLSDPDGLTYHGVMRFRLQFDKE
jgi:hypothetical protein